MIINESPWLRELKQKEKEPNILNANKESDVVIIGGGIAGLSTAFFTLKYTNKRVTLLEGGKIAHGATGHNAGQVVSYFEKPFWKIVEEFGVDLASRAQKSIQSSWNLIDEIYDDAKLLTPLSKFKGLGGGKTLTQLKDHLLNQYLKSKAKLTPEQVFVSKDFKQKDKIPDIYLSFIKYVEHEYLLEILETKETDYIFAVESMKGCMNSALFTEEIAGYLLEIYPERFELFEHSHVSKVTLFNDIGIVTIGDFQIISERIVLCTNGFESIKIFNKKDSSIDKKFHENIEGVIGYMSAYVDESDRHPYAISYLDKAETHEDPYFYLTRRKYEISENSKKDLICVGGPEIKLDEEKLYNSKDEFPKEAQEKIEEFLNRTYKYKNVDKITYLFNWHGLMGYTKNGIRIIGDEPVNKVLMYNLGCNGVGILPSIYGGKRISQIISGKKLKKSIFDPN